jgi:hypothetical protein
MSGHRLGVRWLASSPACANSVPGRCLTASAVLLCVRRSRQRHCPGGRSDLHRAEHLQVDVRELRVAWSVGEGARATPGGSGRPSCRRHGWRGGTHTLKRRLWMSPLPALRRGLPQSLLGQFPRAPASQPESNCRATCGWGSTEERPRLGQAQRSERAHLPRLSVPSWYQISGDAPCETRTRPTGLKVRRSTR